MAAQPDAKRHNRTGARYKDNVRASPSVDPRGRVALVDVPVMQIDPTQKDLASVADRSSFLGRHLVASIINPTRIVSYLTPAPDIPATSTLCSRNFVCTAPWITVARPIRGDNATLDASQLLVVCDKPALHVWKDLLQFPGRSGMKRAARRVRAREPYKGTLYSRVASLLF